ncbi:MAG: pilus assembly protein [Moraxellaceae bacterium]|jgi:Flp pilus assembly protein TadG|nr:pilus assembly protein [Moraxellaceae bacterium]
MRRNKVSATGAAVIEFAFVLPLLLILFFGIVEFSVAFYNKAIITNASREAARSGIVYVGPGTRLSDERIRAIALASSQGLITFNHRDAAPTVAIAVTDSPDFEQDLLTVTVHYQYSGLGLGAILTAVTEPMDLTASTTMKIE